MDDLPVDRRAAAVVGRHARLELAFECRAGRTVLTRAYAEPPLRIGRTFDVDGAASALLVCAAPGVFPGDCLHQHVTVGRGARVILASQSSLQVHPGDGPEPAHVRYNYIVAEGGELHCQWDPVIPFAGARLVQRVELRIARGSRLYWSDALMAGRVGRGETWRFESIDHELGLLVESSLRYLERYSLAPASRKAGDRWIAGDARYAGSVIVHHEAATANLAERVHRNLTAVEGLAAAVDLVEPRLLIARVLAVSGPPFARARSICRRIILDSVFRNPRLVVRR